MFLFGFIFVICWMNYQGWIQDLEYNGNWRGGTNITFLGYCFISIHVLVLTHTWVRNWILVVHHHYCHLVCPSELLRECWFRSIHVQSTLIITRQFSQSRFQTCAHVSMCLQRAHYNEVIGLVPNTSL